MGKGDHMLRSLSVVVLLLASAAHAAELQTPKISKLAGERFLCIATNVGNKPLDEPPFIFRFLDTGGSPISLAGSGLRITPLAAGGAFGVVSTDTTTQAGCHFSGKFARRNVRLTLCRADTSNACLDSVTSP
jgi:hypothetical protein